MAQAQPLEAPVPRDWVLLSNHGYVLLAIAEDPTLRLRDIARAVGITERATIRILRELVEGGVVHRRRVGRRNVYRVDDSAPLRHPTWRDRRVRQLLELVRRDSYGRFESRPAISRAG